MLLDRIQNCLEKAVANHEMAGASVMVRHDGRELMYAQAGMADIDAARPISRDSIFRLYSQSKPITAAAVMLLTERGVIDLMDPVEKFLPGFLDQKVATPDGLMPVVRQVTLIDLLGMTAGLSYPGDDAAGQPVARLFEQAHQRVLAGGGFTTVELADRLGQMPLAFQPGEHFRYSTCADVLGAVVEVADGRSYSRFLREEIFEPLGMKDTGFYVPQEKRDRFVTCYKRVPGGLEPFDQLHLVVGDYTREPAFASGGAGLVSTLDDYAAFADMLMNDGAPILSPQSVRFLTQPQLGPKPLADMWNGLDGFSYGKLMRIAVEPGRHPGFIRMGEYGWDGWLGTYFANLPQERLTILLMQNVTDTGTATVTRKIRNVVLAAESKGELA